MTETGQTFETGPAAFIAAWQPIDTAPQDGTKFLAYEAGEHFDCWWHVNYDEAFWMDWADSEPNPTHWMPLPTPPEKVA